MTQKTIENRPPTGEYIAPDIKIFEILSQGVLCTSGPDTTETTPGGFIF